MVLQRILRILVVTFMCCTIVLVDAQSLMSSGSQRQQMRRRKRPDMDANRERPRPINELAEHVPLAANGGKRRGRRQKLEPNSQDPEIRGPVERRRPRGGHSRSEDGTGGAARTGDNLSQPPPRRRRRAMPDGPGPAPGKSMPPDVGTRRQRRRRNPSGALPPSSVERGPVVGANQRLAGAQAQAARPNVR